jgi:hypothetical protein
MADLEQLKQKYAGVISTIQGFRTWARLSIRSMWMVTSCC